MTRDEIIAAAPEGRLFESYESTANDPWFRIADTDQVFTSHNQSWHPTGVTYTADRLTSASWTEIPRAAILPDPSGDLPDGTRVRVSFEAVAKAWSESADSGYLDSPIEPYSILGRHTLGRINATVEVLALPEPPKAALDGKPGSLWRDPETGTVWVRVALGFPRQFTQVTGPVVRRPKLIAENPRDRAVIARLVPEA